MFILKQFMCFIYFTCLLSSLNCLKAQAKMDSIFIQWNKTTFQSLNRQKQLSTDSMQKELYDNRILSIKEYWGIKSVDDFNTESIRYKLLKLILQKSHNKKNDFYVIENNESGSKVLLRCFVIYVKPGKKTEIDFYEFGNDMWKQTGKFKKERFYLQPDLKSYISEFRKGFNYNDIIITEFKNKQVNESEYYLYSTLSSESNIKTILEGYKKENFLK